MKFVTDEKTMDEYKEFLEKHERCNFQQSPEWAKVKTSWKNEIVLAEDENGKIIGAISVLIRKIPIFGNIMYSSRGPICDIHDIQVMNQLTDGIKELSKKYKIVLKNDLYNKWYGQNITIKYFDKQFIYNVKNSEIEIVV